MYCMRVTWSDSSYCRHGKNWINWSRIRVIRPTSMKTKQHANLLSQLLITPQCLVLNVCRRSIMLVWSTWINCRLQLHTVVTQLGYVINVLTISCQEQWLKSCNQSKSLQIMKDRHTTHLSTSWKMFSKLHFSKVTLANSLNQPIFSYVRFVRTAARRRSNPRVVIRHLWTITKHLRAHSTKNYLPAVYVNVALDWSVCATWKCAHTICRFLTET